MFYFYWKLFFISIFSTFSSVTSKQLNVTLDGSYVGVWLNHTHCFHGGHDDDDDAVCTFEDLTLMTRRITDKFKTIMVDVAPPMETFPPSDNSTFSQPSVWIPSIVAETNKKLQNPQTTPSRVIIPFLAENGDDDGFDTAKMIADHANGIHPGTVSTLLLLRDSSTLGVFRTRGTIYRGPRAMTSSTGEASNALRNAKLKINNGTSAGIGGGGAYKLGITLTRVPQCGGFRTGPNAVYPEIRDSIEHVDVVLVFLEVGEYLTTLHEPHQSMVQLEMSEFEDCERRLKELKPEVDVVPFVYCHSERKVSLQRYAHCWGNFSEWAARSGRELLMYEAVDKYTTDSSSLSARLDGMGWFRVKPGVTFGASALIEKISDLEGTGGNSFFRPKLLTVNFEHNVRYLYDDLIRSYTKKEVFDMVELVTDKFPSIVTPGEHRDSNNSTLWIPAMVASLNANRSNSATTTTTTPPTTVMVSFSPAPPSPIFGDLTIPKAKAAADRANRIYPGTVSTLILKPWHANVAVKRFPRMDDVARTLVNSRNFLDRPTNRTTGAAGGGVSYKLGVFLSGTQCAVDSHQHWSDQTRKTIVDSVDVIVVLFETNWRVGKGLMPQRHTNSYLREHLDFYGEKEAIRSHFHSCQQSFTRLKPEVDVLAGIACTEETEVEVVQCWQFASAWAEEMGKEVIVLDAFDIPTRHIFSGWWKLRDRGIVDIDKDSFVEKIEDINSGGDDGSSCRLLEFQVDENYTLPLESEEVKLDEDSSDEESGGYSSSSLWWSGTTSKIYFGGCLMLAVINAGLVYALVTNKRPGGGGGGGLRFKNYSSTDTCVGGNEETISIGGGGDSSALLITSEPPATVSYRR